ncbi:MAG: hypothetical protein O2816_06450 [Planctomycetota bacterium]|nr:hypothetical protein [Planctomycetota bacterium]
MTKAGNGTLRYVLGEWAIRLTTHHPTAKAWAESRHGNDKAKKKKVRVALSRKLLVGTWKTMCTGEVFDLQRCLATA